MKKTLRSVAYVTLAGLVMTSCSPLKKMEKNKGKVSYKTTPEVIAEKGMAVDVKVDATMPAKYFKKKVTLEASPVLAYANGESVFQATSLQGIKVQGNNTVVPFKESKTVSYVGQVPFTDDMRLSDLKVRFVAKKGKKTRTFDSDKIADGVLATATLVNNAPATSLGGDAFERITKEQKEAAIYYLINSADLRGSQSKSQEIKDMEAFIKEVKAAENRNLKNIQVQSYASPDGATDFNESLAGTRDKVSSKFVNGRLKANKIDEAKTAEFLKQLVVAEDWDGFKTALEASNIQDKELILRVLSMHQDPEVREREIRNIASAFSTIADQILPKLRRSKFVVNAERIGKSDEQIKTLAKSNPAELNVEELLYSATLFNTADEKLAIYKQAQSQFANDWRGYNDAGIIYFEKGQIAEATAAFNKAKSIDAQNKTVLNNLGAIALKNKNYKEAEVLFGAATGLGQEVNYNKGVLAIINGQYNDAVSYFGDCNCTNAALANLLAGNTSKAMQKLNAGNDNSALASYIKAVASARNNDTNAVISNLKAAITKESSMKNLAATDMEFSKLFDNDQFKSVVK
ncbi:MAG: tetratricopeptide repeat protein [Marinifilaceae bacterium]